MSTAVEVLRRFTSDPKIEVVCLLDSYVIMSVKASGADLIIRFIGGELLDDSPSVLVDLVDRDTKKMWSMNLVGNWFEPAQRQKESSDSADNSAAVGDSPQSVVAE